MKETIRLHKIEVEVISDWYNDTVPSIFVYERLLEPNAAFIEPEWIKEDLLCEYGYDMCYSPNLKNNNQEVDYCFNLMLGSNIRQEDEWNKLFRCFCDVVMDYDRYITSEEDRIVEKDGYCMFSQYDIRNYLIEKMKEYEYIDFCFDEPIFEYDDKVLYLVSFNIPNTIKGNMVFNAFTSLFIKECKRLCTSRFTYEIDSILCEKYDCDACSYVCEESGDFVLKMKFENDFDKQSVCSNVMNAMNVLMGRRFNDEDEMEE